MFRFAQFNVTNQVFYSTALSYALVNLKPLVPGHVLVCPRRVVTRLSGLSPEESSDLFATVHFISGVIERYYKADSLNVAIQDGPLAGQSVPHVHCHVIPRKLDDLENVDDIYKLLDGKEGDLDANFRTLKQAHLDNPGALGVDNDARVPRSAQEMESEAHQLAAYIQGLSEH